METKSYLVAHVLSDARRFMVPLYQRKYQWEDDKLNPFWEDVEAKAAEVLEGKNGFHHYMGALILAPLGEEKIIGITPKIQVVDGQQRLTTFQLFLAALREVARDHNCSDLMEQIDHHLFNQKRPKDDDPLAKFKLTPTPSDRDIFHKIVEEKHEAIRKIYAKHYWGNRIPKNTPFQALRAYDLFRQWISRFAKEGPRNRDSDDEDGGTIATDEGIGPEQIKEHLEALLHGVLSRMKLIVITLGEDDDAQVIFETLNSKGKPLLAMDLVRNNIFHRTQGNADAIDEIHKKWRPFDEPWWLKSAPNARPKRPRIDHFLAHVLTAETGKNISVRELYAEYRAFAVPRGKPHFSNVEDELGLLQKHAPIYETLEGKTDVEDINEVMAWLGRKLAAWQVTTAYPIALQIAAADLPAEKQEEIAQPIYSYIVRRAICGLTSKNLNKVFQSIAQLFRHDDPSYAALQKFFGDRQGESTRFPGDEEFRRGIIENPAYEYAPGERIKDILWEFELASRTDCAENQLRPEGLWTEHVLPQTWKEDWPFADGEFVKSDSSDQKALDRNRLLHSLGNLTLLTSKLNIVSGNKGFVEKREGYKKHSTLFLNKWFEKKETWYESDIRERGAYLAEKAIDIWPNIEK